MQRLRSIGVSLMSIACLAIAGCTHPAEPDAYGNVEATEVIVGAEIRARRRAIADSCPVGGFDAPGTDGIGVVAPGKPVTLGSKFLNELKGLGSLMSADRPFLDSD